MITVYGTEWCGDCRRAKRFFELNQVPYDWVDVDANPAAEAYVLNINRGMRSVPTIIFPDGDILVEPSRTQLAEKMGMGIIAA